MAVIVQKFGGTSVADAHRVHLAARRAVRAKLGGKQVVLVVSAMGDTTDKLVALASQVTRRPSKREMDMLLATGEQVSIALMAMAIHEAGHEAISLTGAQVGMLTDRSHTQARIHSIDARRIREHLDAGRIVIVAGFQGVDPDFNITTLGRGGSDTTAVAMAAALEAETCEIYTDVEGVFTTDPRLVPQARRIDAVRYDEMLELAALGAQVVHARAVELAEKYNVLLHVRSSFSDNPGTRIMSQPPGMEDVVVRAATLKPEVARVTFVGLPRADGLTAGVFNLIAGHNIIVDDIIQETYDQRRKVNISFTVDAAQVAAARAAADSAAERYGAAEVTVADDLARVSVVGVGMRSHSGVAARFFDALARENISIENVSTSEIVISVLVRRPDAERALQAVHRAFELDQA